MDITIVTDLKPYKNLYLLIEIADREFESNLLLAFHAVHQKWRVLICHRSYFFNNINKFPNGVVIYKSIVPGDIQLVELVKKRGHIFLCIDAEGIYQRDEGYTLHLRYGQSCLDKIDQIFLLNERQRKLLKENYSIKQEKISVTGYPRIEFLHLLREAKENEIVKELNSKYGKFIFFPTSFAGSNHVLGHYGLKRSFEQVVKKKLNKQRNEFLEVSVVSLSKFVQQKYETLLYEISRNFPEIKIIVRPHPSEDSNYWKRKYKKFNNVIVDFSYPAIYYIKACEVVIQYGSTISIESNILGKPCIQFEPDMPEYLKPHVIKGNQKYVISINSIDKTIRAIEFLVGKEKKDDNKNKYLMNHTDRNMYPSNFGATEKIIEHLNKYINSNNSKKIGYSIPELFSIRTIAWRFVWIISKTGIIDMLPQKLLNGKFKILRKENKILHLNRYKYMKRKASKITMNRANESLKMYRNTWLHLNKKIKIKKISFNAFEVESVE